jgi:hypothetical protein
VSEDDDFKLNALHRFSKRSRLVLESHSHCEVPAGCGGAVLQWVNPAQTIPVRIDVSCRLAVRATHLDGEPIRTSRAQLQPGPHLLALHLEEGRRPEKHPHRYLLVAVGRVLTPTTQDPIAGASTRDDGSWRVSRKKPPADWLADGFDDARWPALGPSAATAADVEDYLRDHFNGYLARGAVPLEVPQGGAWVRKRFVVPPVSR